MIKGRRSVRKGREECEKGEEEREEGEEEGRVEGEEEEKLDCKFGTLGNENRFYQLPHSNGTYFIELKNMKGNIYLYGISYIKTGNISCQFNKCEEVCEITIPKISDFIVVKCTRKFNIPLLVNNIYGTTEPY